MENYIPVATFNNEMEAELAQATLNAAHIASYIKMEDVGGMISALQFTKGVRVLVEEKNFDEAVIVLEQQALAQDENE
jgi:hypothetical protein